MRKVITITGPSGSGKDSIVDGLLFITGQKPREELSPFIQSKTDELLKLSIAQKLMGSCNLPYIRELISHTTRKPRVGEVHGKDYYFVSDEEFDPIEKIESTIYSGNKYCLSKAELDNPTEIGIVIVDIEGKGAVQDYMGERNTESIFLKVPPDVIEGRMIARGDSPENVRRRLENAKATHEFENGKYCKYIIENDDYIEAIKKAIHILESI